MLSPLPRRSGWAYCFAHSPQPYQPSPKTPSGRPAHCPFRGLLGVHLRYGLHTRAATVFRDTLSEGFSHFVTSMTAPVASGWSSCRVGFSPTGKRRLYTAHGHSGHCSALAHIANSGIFPAQSLKQGTKCRNSTTRRVCVTTALMFKATTAHTTNAACASGGGRQTWFASVLRFCTMAAR